MKNICPKCGKEPDGVVRTKLGDDKALYSFIHAEEEGTYSECRVHTKVKAPKSPGVDKPG